MTQSAISTLTDKDYQLFRRLVYTQSGINLGEHKLQLVKSRLGKLVREGGFPSYRAFYHHVRNDAAGEALCVMLDAITTNTTHLFREINHFHFLRDTVIEWAGDRAWRRAHKELRIWSAACSSGEEPHSLAMTTTDALRRSSGLPFKILATDLSSVVLSRAKLALYEPQRVGTVPYGFDLGDDGGTLVENADEQRIIRDIRDLRVSGKSYRRIARVLTERGIATKSGRTTWAGRTVQQISVRTT